ncbi:uncharacterized protein BJ171DRAFT_307802 [Polychytrium aggregatum]|uniref:uncharacterized protein n=1 Tax=Polychytrium aggregatum TaxID=110093 RepID=UPI0022FDE971|nr:uncharacterized protein BJ171DRAFT_307802 [Polychytrium aggregatum]KAI9206861.1 hypothetical protein BJ171DRAFT_307802 [Polychytrium aggregatum]
MGGSCIHLGQPRSRLCLFWPEGCMLCFVQYLASAGSATSPLAHGEPMPPIDCRPQEHAWEAQASDWYMRGDGPVSEDRVVSAAAGYIAEYLLCSTHQSPAADLRSHSQTRGPAFQYSLSALRVVAQAGKNSLKSHRASSFSWQRLLGKLSATLSMLQSQSDASKPELRLAGTEELHQFVLTTCDIRDTLLSDMLEMRGDGWTALKSFEAAVTGYFDTVLLPKVVLRVIVFALSSLRLHESQGSSSVRP